MPQKMKLFGLHKKLWLILFGANVRTISEHLQNIFKTIESTFKILYNIRYIYNFMKRKPFINKEHATVEKPQNLMKKFKKGYKSFKQTLFHK
jgi:hypothetical protein